jgi:hypothetical protein
VGRSVAPRPRCADRDPAELVAAIRLPDAPEDDDDDRWTVAGAIPSPTASCDIEWIEAFAYVLSCERHDAARAAAAMLLDLVDELERRHARNVADLPASRVAELLPAAGGRTPHGA